MNYAALIFWLLIAWSATASAQTVLVLLLGSVSFASLALIPLEITGGISILPQSVFSVLLIWKVLGPQALPLSSKLASALRLQNLGFLALFLLVSIVTALIMPRLFSEDVVIIPMRENSAADLLHPIMANLTQSGYVTLSVLTVFAVTLISGESGFLNTLRAAMLTGGIVCIVTGLVDLVASSTGLSALLEPFRNASYAYLTEVDIGGTKRVVGLTPEASVYGPICVEFAAAIGLLRTLYPEGRERLVATVVAVSLVAMALLSTSSTAFGGLAVLVLVYALNWIRRAFFSSSLGQREVRGELLVGFGAMIALLVVVLVHASLFNPLLDLIDEVVLNKPLSSSFIERSHWNTVAWNTVASTWGLGVGLGSTRTSNWFTAIMSNAGLLGAAFMGIFLVQTFAKRANWQSPLTTELLAALKLSLLPALAMAAVASPGPDFGVWMAVTFGAITGVGAFVLFKASSFQSSRKQAIRSRPAPTDLARR
jgi:hypothetical protein